VVIQQWSIITQKNINNMSDDEKLIETMSNYYIKWNEHNTSTVTKATT